jgi:hypothetical protein
MLAWLNASPERAKEDKTPKLSRLQTFRKYWVPEWDAPLWVIEALRETYMPEMPPLEQGGYLVAALMEVGPTVPSGMGVGPVEWPHIEAWSRRMNVDLLPWQSQFIRRLSQEYLSESHKAEKKDAPAPWTVGEAVVKVTDTQAAIRALAKL